MVPAGAAGATAEAVREATAFGARPAAATMPPSLARKDLRVLSELTGDVSG